MYCDCGNAPGLHAYDSTSCLDAGEDGTVHTDNPQQWLLDVVTRIIATHDMAKPLDIHIEWLTPTQTHHALGYASASTRTE